MKTESLSPHEVTLVFSNYDNTSMTPSSQQQSAVNKTLQETPGFRMRKFNKNKRFKENYFEMRMMDTSATCSSFEGGFSSNIYAYATPTLPSTTSTKATPKRKATSSQSLQSTTKKRKQSIETSLTNNNGQMNQQNTFIVNSTERGVNNNGSINSLPIFSFDSNDTILPSSAMPSFALSSHVIDQEFPNLNDNFFSTDPSRTKETPIENTSNSLVDLLMSNNKQLVVDSNVNNNTPYTPSCMNSGLEHIAPITTQLKSLVGDVPSSSSCNNSIASPSASSSLSNSTVCNHLLISNEHATTTQQHYWNNILPLKPVCIDEVCSEWEQLLENTNTTTEAIDTNTNNNTNDVSVPIIPQQSSEKNL